MNQFLLTQFFLQRNNNVTIYLLFNLKTRRRERVWDLYILLNFGSGSFEFRPRRNCNTLLFTTVACIPRVYIQNLFFFFFMEPTLKLFFMIKN